MAPCELPSAGIPAGSVTRSGSCLAIMIVFPSLLAFVWTIVMLMLIPTAIEDRKISERGVDASAQITDLHIENGRGRPTHYVGYSYQAEIQAYSQKTAIPANDYAKLKLGEILPILYDPLKPYRSAVNIGQSARIGERYRESLFSIIVITIGIAILGTISILIPNHLFLRQKVLLERGLTAPAQIIGEVEHKVRGRRYAKVSYEFTVPQHGVFTGTRKYVPTRDSVTPEEIASRASFIDNPTAFYLPDKPTRHALYPMEWARIDKRSKAGLVAQ